MKNQLIHFCAVVLTVLMTGSAFLSCGDASVAEGNVTAGETTSAAETSADTAAETQFVMPDLPTRDYGGTDFVILDSGINDDNGADWETYDIYVEQETGDVITDAVYQRNVWLEDTFNIKIKEVKSTTSVLNQAKKSILAGSADYDMLVANICAAETMGQNGYIFDLNEVPNIDLTQSWWDQRMISDLSIGGKNYFATGDITVIDNDATWVLMFNKQMAQDNDVGDLYEMVRNNTWTIDKFYAISQSVSKDLDGNGKMEYDQDQFGFFTSSNSSQGLLYASGLKMCTKDKDDYPVLGTDMDRMTTVTEMAATIMADKTSTFNDDINAVTPADMQAMFESGHSLFFGEVLQCVIRMRESKTDFGVIPWPKYDENQDSYYNNTVASAAKVVAIPVTQADTDKAGLIVEAMAAKSVPTLTNAYYDVALTYKYMRDEESAEMLDIILQSRTYDLAYVFNWGNLYSTIRDAIALGKKEFSSTWAKKESAAEKAIAKTVAAFQENT